jgi:D-glycero-beta-D-manno-heptose-7-phosphate kinase
MNRADRRAVCLDRDGTVIEDVGYPRDPGRVRLLPGAGAALAELKGQGFLLILISNQSGIGRGLLTQDEADQVHRQVVSALREFGVHLDAAYYCPHAPEERCRCRKPSPQMLLRAAEECDFDLAGSFMVGDKPSDVAAGKQAGCRTILLAAHAPAGGWDPAPDDTAADWPEVLGRIRQLGGSGRMREKPFRELLAAFPGRRVLIVGDVMLDEYIWGDVRRISPEAPVPVVEMQRRTYVPGGAANAAANVVSLGGVALLGGVVGRDHQAEQLGAALRLSGVEANGLFRGDGRQTTTKTRIIAHSQQMVRVDCEQRAPLSLSEEDRLLQWVETQLPGAAACILSDYAKGVVSPRLAEHVIRMARQVGKPVVVDPKGTNYAKYRGATVIKPNIHEAERFAKQEITGERSLLEVGRQLAGVLDGSAVLVTRGAQGMSLLRSGFPPAHIPAVAHNVFDVTGAGDTVISTLAMALAAGSTLEQATHLANRAASIVVGKVGTATVTLEELKIAASR